MKNLDCKHCDSSIIKSYGTEAKMRSKLIKWTSDGMFAVCKSCGTENEIHTDFVKSMQSSFVYEVNQPAKKLENQRN